MNSPPLLFSFISSSPNSWSSFNRYHCCIYIHVYTLFAPYSPSYPLSPSPLPSHWCQPFPVGKTCFSLQFSDCVEEKGEEIKQKTWHFSWSEIKVTTQGFCIFVRMYYNPNWIISSKFLHSTLVPFFMEVSVGLRFLYSFLYREYNNLIQAFIFPTPPVCDLSLVWPVFYNIASFVLGLWERTCGFGPSESGWIHKRWCPPVPSI
jgi:hypothetical protein